MKRLLLILFSVSTLSTLIAQETKFVVTRDTITFDIQGDLQEALIVDDKYYCFFQPIFPTGMAPKKMYIIAGDGTIEHCLDSLPYKFNGLYSDFHLRNDSILFKTTCRKCNTYIFDKQRLTWGEIAIKDDLVYEDDEFYVTSLDFGEWGGATWFRDKKTGKEYRLSLVSRIINKLGENYFLCFGNRILKIKDPREMHECFPGEYYGYTVKNEKYYDEVYYKQGIETIYSNIPKSPYYPRILEPNECVTSMQTSFLANEKLYHLLMDSCKLSIAELQNGKLEKIKLIAEDISTYSLSNSYRCSIQKDGSQIIRFGVRGQDLFGLMKIKGDTIAFHYFNNMFKERLNPRGKEKTDVLFKEFFSSVFSKYNNKNIYEIRDYLVNTNQAIDITGVMDDSEIDNSRMAFRIVEDSIFDHQISYIYSKRNGLPKRSVYVLKNQNRYKYIKNDEKHKVLYEKRFEEIKQYIDQYLQEHKLVKSRSVLDKYSLFWKTTLGGTIDLQAGGRNEFQDRQEIRLFINYGKKQ